MCACVLGAEGSQALQSLRHTACDEGSGHLKSLLSVPSPSLLHVIRLHMLKDISMHRVTWLGS